MTQEDIQTQSPQVGASNSATRASTVYLLLRQDIVRAKVLPGEKLRIEHLTERYGVGPTPVREALNRLSAEGLVYQQDQRGFRVAPVSVANLLEVVQTRIWVDEIALREAMNHGDDAWEEGILLTYRRLSKTSNRLADDSRSANPDWENQHHAFHQALLAACPSKTLLNFCQRLFESSDRYRHLAVRHTQQGARDVKNEHKALMEAVIERRAQEALTLLREHSEQTLKTLLAILNQSESLTKSE